jgi:hypothetical protein
MAIALGLQQIVWKRATARCEYCHLPSEADIISFCIDHVTPRKHGGSTVVENLALACALCNRYKLDNLSGIDPLTSTITPLFNPRREVWNEHFAWSGSKVLGLSAAGRATIDVLRINLVQRIRHRDLLISLGKFPQP